MADTLREALHLKVRGVALWIKTLRGEAPAVVDAAFETLLQAADVLSTIPAEPRQQPGAERAAWQRGYFDGFRAAKLDKRGCEPCFYPGCDCRFDRETNSLLCQYVVRRSPVELPELPVLDVRPLTDERAAFVAWWREKVERLGEDQVTLGMHDDCLEGWLARAALSSRPAQEEKKRGDL